MPIVYVHGVAVRRAGDPDFEQVSRVTQGAEWSGIQAKLRRFVAPVLRPEQPESVHIQEIYWGDLGAQLVLSEPVPPLLAPEQLTQAQRADALEDRLRPILPTRQWPELTRVAWQVAANIQPGATWEALHSEMLRQLYQASSDMVKALRQKLGEQLLGERLSEKLPHWLSTSASQLSAQTHISAQSLMGHLPASPTIGTLKEQLTLSALAATPTVMSRHGVRRAMSSVRRPIESFVPIFLGDVMTYLNHRGTPQSPGQIPLRVIQGLQQAQAAAPTEPLIVLTHSMGGQLVYDLLTAFLPVQAPEIRVDFWCACASQVGLFKELKLFLEDLEHGYAPLETQLAYFWNVWSYSDVLSFPAQGRVTGVHETAFVQTTNSLRGDHLGYLQNDVFYELLAIKASLSLQERLRI